MNIQHINTIGQAKFILIGLMRGNIMALLPKKRVQLKSSLTTLVLISIMVTCCFGRLEFTFYWPKL